MRGTLRAALSYAFVVGQVVAVRPTVAQAPIPLDTVRVGAASRLVAGAATATRSIDVLERAQIDALPARSVSDVLARALGVDLQARSAAQADVAIRGASFEQVLVMVDGVPVNDDQTGHFHLDLTVPLDAVERIEVLRGPASALYGSSAVGGVINVVTRRALREVNARAQGGSFGAAAFALDAAGSAAGATARISAEHDRADGHRPGTDHRITQARVAIDAPVARSALRAEAGFAARDFGANYFYAPFNSYEETRAATGSLSWRSAPGSWSVAPRVSFRQHDDDFILKRDTASFYHNQHTNKQAIGEVVARWAASASIKLAAGADAARSWLESNNLNNHDEDRYAAFVELAAGDVARTLLTTGVRIDHHSTFGTFLSPSVAAGHRVSPRLNVRASAGGGYRAPSWTERYYTDPANIGDPNLDAESFWTGEIGAALMPGDNYTVDVALFVRRSEDLVDWARPVGSTAPWRTMNIETATFRGLESTLLATLQPIRLTARAALLDVDAKETGGMTSKYALRPLRRALSLELGAALVRGVDLSVRGSHSARAAADPTADDDTWNLIDARIRWSWRSLTLFADATNVTDEQYDDVSVRPAPGRAFAFGVRLRRQ